MFIGNWGGYSNGRYPLDVMTELEGVYLHPEFARRVKWAFREIREDPDTYIIANEGYRDLAGQEYWLDYYGGDTSWAATPGYSNHGFGGLALDCDTNNLERRRAIFARVGIVQNIPKESWHFVPSGDVEPGLDIDALPAAEIIPPEPKDIEMIGYTSPVRLPIVVSESYVTAYDPNVFAVITQGMPVVALSWPNGQDWDTIVRETWARSEWLANRDADMSADEITRRAKVAADAMIAASTKTRQ